MKKGSEDWILKDDGYMWMHKEKPIEIMRFTSDENKDLKCLYIRIHNGDHFLSDYKICRPDNKELFELAEEMYYKHINKDDVSIYELDLSVRSYNSLKSNNVNTIGDLRNLRKKDLMEFRNMGKRSMNEVVETLERMGIEMKSDEGKN